MNILIKIRNLLYIIRIFYWISFKAVAKSYFQGNRHRSQELWAKETVSLLRTKIYRFENSHDLRREKTIILTNHRSQADFWIHAMITDYTCSFLSRLAVGIVFFVFGLFARKVVWFFNRSGKIDHNKFNQWLNEKFSQSPRPSLLIYPEGHRMYQATKVDKTKMKSGMLKYAYREKIKIQILMAFGNQLIFNEKKLDMKWDQKVFYSFSKVYDPQTFETQREFVDYIKNEFSDYFDEIWKKYSEGQAAEEVTPLLNHQE